MSERATMPIEKRENTSTRLSRQLRNKGFVPASISSRGKESISVSVKRDDFIKNLTKHGRNYLFNLDLEGKDTIIAMVKNMYYSPIKRDLIAIDFQQISLDEDIKIDLDVRLVGRDIVEFKKLLVILHMNQVPVKGLPQFIPDFLEIDVTDLEADDKITIADIKLPKGILAEDEEDRVVVTVTRPKMVEEETEEDEDEGLEEETAETPEE